MKLDRGKVKIFFFMVFEFLNQNQVYPLKMTFMFSKTRLPGIVCIQLSSWVLNKFKRSLIMERWLRNKFCLLFVMRQSSN